MVLLSFFITAIFQRGNCLRPEPGLILRTETPPVIDADFEEVWERAVEHPLMNSVVPHGDAFKIESPEDFSASWWGLWDDNHVYFFFDVKDDIRILDSGHEDWQDDALRTWMTPDNNRNRTWDDPNDFNYECPRDKPAFSPPHWDLQVISARKEQDYGWSFEIQMSYSDWGLSTPDPGDSISLEMEVDDDDDGGLRDSKLMWWTDINSLVSKMDASAIGKAFYVLEIPISVFRNREYAKMFCFNNEEIIMYTPNRNRNINKNYVLSILGVNGKQIYASKTSIGFPLSVPIPEKSGIYLLTVGTGSERFSYPISIQR
jgi:hypothetical protein